MVSRIVTHRIGVKGLKKQLRIEDDEPVNRGGRQALLKPKRVDCQPIASGFEEVGGC